MSNSLSTFVFNNVNSVRVIDIDGAPWFVALDVAYVLGWTRDNLKYHTKRNLHADEKRVVRLPGSEFRSQNIISESGLYKLIMRSDKPEAKAFQDWVTKVVLPAIRKDGEVFANSRDVADFFGRRHDNVLQSIDMADCSRDFRRLNFQESLTDVRNGFMVKATRSVDMTRDGFTFLVMGFTGSVAGKFKEAYINEFNRMERELKARPASVPALPTSFAEALRLAVGLIPSDQGERQRGWSPITTTSKPSLKVIIRGRHQGNPMGATGSPDDQPDVLHDADHGLGMGGGMNCNHPTKKIWRDP